MVRLLATRLEFLRAPIAGLLLAALANSAHAEVPVQPARPHPLQVGYSDGSATWLEVARSPLLRGDLSRGQAVSCAAAACHGGTHPGVAQATASRGAEYPLWLQHDPHARSWQTLGSEPSAAILRRLGILRDGRIMDPAGFRNCLACHDTVQSTDIGCQSTSHEGVGCAACHGPTELWLKDHYLQPLDSAHATGQGFVDNKNLLTRARMCATCHVGDRDRDVNHDLIAAGHPELRYEFATYHARLPKHWREHGECPETSGEAMLWLVGQIASLDASLTLLESRAQAPRTTAAWPEFAEYRCASCHRPLRPAIEPSRDSLADYPSWSVWHRAGLLWLLDHARQGGKDHPQGQELVVALARLEEQMNAGRKTTATEVGAAARTARHALDRWLQGPAGQDVIARFDADQLLSMAESVRELPQVQSDWELSVQSYLAMIAARSAWPDGRMGMTAKQLHEQRSRLQFPVGLNSPP